MIYLSPAAVPHLLLGFCSSLSLELEPQQWLSRLSEMYSVRNRLASGRYAGFAGRYMGPRTDFYVPRNRIKSSRIKRTPRAKGCVLGFDRAVNGSVTDFLNVEMETPTSYVRFSVAIGFLDGSHLSRVGFLQPLPTLSLVDIYTEGIAKYYISSVPIHFTDEN